MTPGARWRSVRGARETSRPPRRRRNHGHTDQTPAGRGDRGGVRGTRGAVRDGREPPAPAVRAVLPAARAAVHHLPDPVGDHAPALMRRAGVTTGSPAGPG